MSKKQVCLFRWDYVTNCNENKNDDGKINPINKTYIDQDVDIKTNIENIAFHGMTMSFFNKQHFRLNLWKSYATLRLSWKKALLFNSFRTGFYMITASVMKELQKACIIRSVEEIIANLITQYFILNFANIFVVTAVSYAVNDTLTIRLWRFLTCQNSPADINALIVMTGLINLFHATDLFWYPLKTSENLRFSDVFRGYQKRSVAWNGLIAMHYFQKTFHFLSVSNCLMSILSNISITSRKSHKTIFVGYWDMFETP